MKRQSAMKEERTLEIIGFGFAFFVCLFCWVWVFLVLILVLSEVNIHEYLYGLEASH